jgi:hypothetical protein
MPRVDYNRIPSSTMYGLKGYVEDGRPVGGFLTAVICNDLSEAIGRADEGNYAALLDIVAWLYNEAPGSCWGSVEKFEAWTEKKRAEYEAARQVGAEDAVVEE